MNTIKQIKMSKDTFNVLYDNSSLKLNFKNEKSRYVIDISQMNLINAVKIAILCSTYCFIKDFKKNLCWIVCDEEIKKAISILRLKNIDECIIRQSKKKKLELAS